MMKQKENKPSKLSTIIIIASVIGVLGVLYILHLNNTLVNIQLELDKKSYQLGKIYEDSKTFEGKYIWEATAITEQIFYDFINDNKIDDSFLFLSLDSISCYSCFKYHIENIEKLQGFDMVGYSRINNELLRERLPNILLLPLIEIKDFSKDKFLTNDLVISLVNTNGQIIYADVSDKRNYEKSEVFYKIISKFQK